MQHQGLSGVYGTGPLHYSILASWAPSKVSIILLLELRKLRLRERKQLVWRHSADEWQRQDTDLAV